MRAVVSIPYYILSGPRAGVWLTPEPCTSIHIYVYTYIRTLDRDVIGLLRLIISSHLLSLSLSLTTVRQAHYVHVRVNREMSASRLKRLLESGIAHTGQSRQQQQRKRPAATKPSTEEEEGKKNDKKKKKKPLLVLFHIDLSHTVPAHFDGLLFSLVSLGCLIDSRPGAVERVWW